MQHSPVELKRTLGLPVLTFYGLGTIIGAGIYVLVGKVAGAAGDFLPWSFLLAGLIAAFTALSYSELAARYPRSAGAALYAQMAYRRQIVSQIIGWMVIFTGVVSASAIINGFHGYLNIFVSIPPLAAEVGLALFLVLVAAWGIRESALLITIITLLEVGGLFYVLAIGMQAPASEFSAMPTVNVGATGLFMGAFLAFYAFIGFEDMVNVVEEVKQPRRNLPIAILASVTIATILYVFVAVVALNAMPATELAASDAPLATLVAQAGLSPQLIAAISLVAVINGALVQIIMASRVIYGMARHSMAPEGLGHVHPFTQTPVRATVLVGFLVLGFALWLPIQTLAGLTSLAMLAIFAFVNAGLVIIKRRNSVTEGFVVPTVVPVIGAILCVSLLIAQLIG